MILNHDKITSLEIMRHILFNLKIYIFKTPNTLILSNFQNMNGKQSKLVKNEKYLFSSFYLFLTHCEDIVTSTSQQWIFFFIFFLFRWWWLSSGCVWQPQLLNVWSMISTYFELWKTIWRNHHCKWGPLGLGQLNENNK